MAAAYQPLSKRFESFLQCGTCTEVKEIKMLSCKHRICQKCIFDICSKKDGGCQSACPYCNSPLSKKPDQYLVCRVIQYFQKHQKEIEHLLEKIVSDRCVADGCVDGVTKICRKCKKTFCSESEHHNECNMANGGAHNLEDIIDYCEEIKASFNQWKAREQELIQDLKSQREETILELKQRSQGLVNASSDEIQQLTATTTSALSELGAELSRLDERIVEEKITLQVVQGVTGGIRDLELVVIFSHLLIYDQLQKVEIGCYTSLVEGVISCDIVWSPAGHLLIARNGGIDVVEITTDGTATITNTLLEGEDIFSVEVFNTNILAAVNRGEPFGPTEVVTLDRNYKERSRWAANLSAIDFAVTDNKVVFSVRGLPSLKVYSMSGKVQPDIPCENPVAGLFGVLDGVLFADEDHHKVYRKKVSENSCVWTAEVIAPFVACVDENELVWVRANTYDHITILSRHGEKWQEIEDERFTSLTVWGGIMVHGGYLYVTHADGVGRFELTYVDI